MEKYVQIRDMRGYDSYRNPTARLLYLHLACSCDVSTYNNSRSIRQLAFEVGVTVSALRHALQQLLNDGLVTRVPTTQIATQTATQTASHLHIMKVNELQPTNDTDCATDCDTDCVTLINNKIINKTSPHTMRAREAELKALAAGEFGLDEPAAAAAVEAFMKRQALKKKQWDSEGDALAHFISWCEKRLPRHQQQPKTDTAARAAEYQRAKEAEKAASQQEQEREELARLLRWKAERETSHQTSGRGWDGLCSRIEELMKKLSA